MHKENTPQSLVVWNHKLMPESQLNSSEYSDFDMIYEVLRIIDGKFMFLNDHVCRLKTSLKLAGDVVDLDDNQLLIDMCLCVKENQIVNGNMRVSIFPSDAELLSLCEIIPHSYPSLSEYENGVPVAVARFVRNNPNVKKWNASMKDVVKRYKSMRKVYEVLFYNEKFQLTEGSQSNLFFIVGNTVVTAPDNLVLKGITREYVMKAISEAGYTVKFEAVQVADVLKYDAVFITGTSPKVLPVSEIVGCCKTDVNHPVLRQIMHKYDDILMNNLKG